MLQLIMMVWLGTVQASTGTQPPLKPLQGEWTVEVIDRIKVLPEARVSLAFQGNRVTGSASCNAYQGLAEVSGQRLQITGILATMKACDDARMRQEREFLELLRHVERYEVQANGNLLQLTTAEGKTITARRRPAG